MNFTQVVITPKPRPIESFALLHACGGAAFRIVEGKKQDKKNLAQRSLAAKQLSACCNLQKAVLFLVFNVYPQWPAS